VKIIPVKTRKLLPPKDDIFKLLNTSLPKLKEGDVLLVASKLLSIHQGRAKKLKVKSEKLKIIKQEAERWIQSKMSSNEPIVLTIKNHTLIPNAGIDESNAKGYILLWPKNTGLLCKQIWQFLKKKNKIKKLAIVAIDSHCVPLRWGTVGISIGHFGIEPVLDYRGKKDLFGKKLKWTRKNIVDALAAMGTFMMGEGNEQIPLVIIRGMEGLKFTNKDTRKKLVIKPKKDLYYPLLKSFKKFTCPPYAC